MKISLKPLTKILFVLYFIMAFAVNPAAIPSRGYVMTALVFLLFFSMGDFIIRLRDFSVISIGLAIIFFAYGISGVINIEWHMPHG